MEQKLTEAVSPRRCQMADTRRGEKIEVVPEATPEDALSSQATVIFGNLWDDKVGKYHNVMFGAGVKGVIFKSILDKEVK